MIREVQLVVENKLITKLAKSSLSGMVHQFSQGANLDGNYFPQSMNSFTQLFKSTSGQAC